MSNMAISAAEARQKSDAKEGAYKVVTTTMTFATRERVELKTITEEVAAFVEASPVQHGMILVSSLHTTAGIMLNETQDALLADIRTMFEQVLPQNVYYKHNDPIHSDCDRKNADAHLRAIFVGQSITIPIVDGKLKLGTWQNILLTEFDGPNNRRVHLQLMGI